MPSSRTIELARQQTERSYDQVAAAYAAHFQDELQKKPFDRMMLDLLIEKVDDSGMICDLGCGPGQVAGYLQSRGAASCGIDLSAEMVRQARLLNPLIPFQTGDMLSLRDVADDSYGGIAAFYSIIHIPRPSVTAALKEIRRVLRPSGRLLFTFHLGRETVTRDELFGVELSLDFHFFEREEMKGYLQEAGFELEEVIERDPYAEVEYPSRRAYIFARNPS